MPVVSISVERVKARRSKDIAYTGQALTIVPHPAFIDIVEVKDEKTGSPFLLVPFKHTITYKPALGTFRVEGHILYATTEEKKKEILGMWGKKKRVPDDVFVELMTSLANRALFIEANMAFELGIPSPIRLPKSRG